jgi:hypothetical protein
MMRLPRVLPLVLLTPLVLPSAGDAQFRRNREPTVPPPTIIEYKPHSTLVVPEHPVPRAKFPAVDVHGHPPTLDNPETIRQVVTAMDELNLQVIVQARGSSGERLTRQIEAVRAAGYEDRFVFFTTLDLRDVSPGSGSRIAAQLEADVAAGAVGIGEINKGSSGRRLAASGFPSSSTPATRPSSSRLTTCRTSAGWRWHSSPVGSSTTALASPRSTTSWRSGTG